LSELNLIYSTNKIGRNVKVVDSFIEFPTDVYDTARNVMPLKGIVMFDSNLPPTFGTLLLFILASHS